MRLECSPTEFLKTAAHTAEHFGFKSIEAIKKDPICKQCATSLPNTLEPEEATIDDLYGLLTGGVKTYCDAQLHAFTGPVLVYGTETVPRTKETAITFHIFNVPKSIAEAILIHTSRTLMHELGHTDHTVRINSLGDSDSLLRYTREVTSYLRKRLDILPSDTRELMKEHPLLALQSLITVDHELAAKAPNPLEHLSDQSRKHFRDIIEYLDMSETPYEIDTKMLGHHDCYSDALFAIESSDDETTGNEIRIRGGRFDAFMHRKTNCHTGAVGAVAILKNKPAPSRAPRFKLDTPSVYVIQLGFGPKIRSLLLIDELRKAGISTHQDLANDSLSAQLRDAEQRAVKYVVIIGQKEFVEGTVILRNMETRKQEPVLYPQLIRRLKRTVSVSA